MQSTTFNQSFQLLRSIRQPFTLQVQSIPFYSNLFYLSAIWLPHAQLPHYQADGLTPPSDGHRQPRNEFGSIGPAERLVRCEPEIFGFDHNTLPHFATNVDQISC